MAILRIPEENILLTEEQSVKDRLSVIGIGFESWPAPHTLRDNCSAQEALAAYSVQIERLKQLGGYVTSDVIDVTPQTPGLDAMLARFNREHWHDEDEVRFILAGRGVFHIHPKSGPVVSIEVEPGDLLRVPRGTHHWFDLCADRKIRAIRLFQDVAGWTPHYTESGADKRYQPACFGPAYVRAS
jgi:1,2-dihydroxy-3-keto-5-methylthiopentene dioxygenase